MTADEAVLEKSHLMQKVKMADYCRPEVAGDVISGANVEGV